MRVIALLAFISPSFAQWTDIVSQATVTIDELDAEQAEALGCVRSDVNSDSFVGVDDLLSILAHYHFDCTTTFDFTSCDFATEGYNTLCGQSTYCQNYDAPEPAPPPPDCEAPAPCPAPEPVAECQEPQPCECASLAISNGPYTAGEPIIVSFTGATDPTDWIGLYAAGSDLSDYASWVYHHSSQTNSGDLVESGYVTLVPPYPGTFFVAFLAANGYEELDPLNAPRISFMAEAPDAHVPPAITISDGPYLVGEPITVNYVGATSSTDWIGMYEAGSDLDSSYISWVYHHGTQADGELQTSGSVELTPPAPGEYFISFLANNGYQEFPNCRIEILVTGEPLVATLSISPSSGPDNTPDGTYYTGYPITVSFTGASSTTDWIGFYEEGSDLEDYHSWLYHHGTQDSGELVTDGDIVLTPPTAGSFFVAFLANNGYTEVNAETAPRIHFDVTQGPGFTISDGPYVTGEPLTVTYVGARSATDWIGIIPEGAPLTEYASWVYHHGTTDSSGELVPEGTVTVALPSSPGNYYVAFLADNGYTELDAVSAPRIDIVVGGEHPPPVTLTVETGPYFAGAPITVSFTGATSSTDWIGFYQAGADITSYTDWVYHHGTQDDSGAVTDSDSVTFTPQTSGLYYIAFLQNNGYIPFNCENVLDSDGNGGQPCQIEISVCPAWGCLDAVMHIADGPYCVGGTVDVSFSGASSSTDWIGLYVAGSPLDQQESWAYHHGTTESGDLVASGVVQLPLTTAGDFYVAFLANDGYTLLDPDSAPSIPFTVEDCDGGNSGAVASGVGMVLSDEFVQHLGLGDSCALTAADVAANAAAQSLIEQFIVTQAANLGIDGCSPSGQAAGTCPINVDELSVDDCGPAVSHEVELQLSNEFFISNLNPTEDTDGDECSISADEIASNDAAVVFACALASSTASSLEGVECPLEADGTCPDCEISIDSIGVQNAACGDGETGRRRLEQPGTTRVVVGLAQEFTDQVNAVQEAVKESLGGLL